MSQLTVPSCPCCSVAFFICDQFLTFTSSDLEREINKLNEKLYTTKTQLGQALGSRKKTLQQNEALQQQIVNQNTGVRAAYAARDAAEVRTTFLHPKLINC